MYHSLSFIYGIINSSEYLSEIFVPVEQMTKVAVLDDVIICAAQNHNKSQLQK